MANKRFSKLTDFFERVCWTAVQAAAGVAIATGFDDWTLTAKASGIAALVAALKVVIAQNAVGTTADGAIPSPGPAT